MHFHCRMFHKNLVDLRFLLFFLCLQNLLSNVPRFCRKFHCRKFYCRKFHCRMFYCRKFWLPLELKMHYKFSLHKIITWVRVFHIGCLMGKYHNSRLKLLITGKNHSFCMPCSMLLRPHLSLLPCALPQ